MDIFYNEFILKIKSRDNRLLNIHDLMNNKKVAAILPYELIAQVVVNPTAIRSRPRRPLVTYDLGTNSLDQSSTSTL